jgi:hypothetical protein
VQAQHVISGEIAKNPDNLDFSKTQVVAGWIK